MAHDGSSTATTAIATGFWPTSTPGPSAPAPTAASSPATSASTAVPVGLPAASGTAASTDGTSRSSCRRRGSSPTATAPACAPITASATPYCSPAPPGTSMSGAAFSKPSTARAASRRAGCASPTCTATTAGTTFDRHRSRGARARCGTGRSATTTVHGWPPIRGRFGARRWRGAGGRGRRRRLLQDPARCRGGWMAADLAAAFRAHAEPRLPLGKACAVKLTKLAGGDAGRTGLRRLNYTRPASRRKRASSR